MPIFENYFLVLWDRLLGREKNLAYLKQDKFLEATQIFFLFKK